MYWAQDVIHKNRWTRNIKVFLFFQLNLGSVLRLPLDGWNIASFKLGFSSLFPWWYWCSESARVGVWVWILVHLAKLTFSGSTITSLGPQSMFLAVVIELALRLIPKDPQVLAPSLGPQHSLCCSIRYYHDELGSEDFVRRRGITILGTQKAFHGVCTTLGDEWG